MNQGSKALIPLLKKIEKGTAHIGILGMGYVGLPLAMAFSKKFITTGYEPDLTKIDKLLKGISYIDDISNEQIKAKLKKKFFPSYDIDSLEDVDFFIICVPTPLGNNHEPDLSYIIDASKTIANVIKKGSFVILESTTYPGTTDEIVGPILEESGLKIGIDFGLAFSPERIDPGNKKWTINNTPKVVGGINDQCTEIASRLYSSITSAKIVKVKDAKTAESVKLVENIFRGVNIALVNELALIFEKMGIDTWEVIDAAATKPHSFMAHYPGPGVGGHCIPLDPFYLSYRAQQFGIIPRFIQSAGAINEYMTIHVINLIRMVLSKKNKKVRGSKILLLGVAYKGNISDVRESPGIKIIEGLNHLGAIVKFYDPCVERIKTSSGSVNMEPTDGQFFKNADIAVITTNHEKFKQIIPKYLDKRISIVDCCNLLNSCNIQNKIYYLGKSLD